MWSRELREDLAASEHDQWRAWASYMLSHMTLENVLRWLRQSRTDYADLPPAEQRSDRQFVERTLDILERHGVVAPPEEALMDLKGHVATAIRAQPECTLRLYVDAIDECGNCPAYRHPCHGGQPYCVRTGRKIIWGSNWAGTPTWCPLKQIDAAGVSE